MQVSQQYFTPSLLTKSSLTVHSDGVLDKQNTAAQIPKFGGGDKGDKHNVTVASTLKSRSTLSIVG